MLPVFIREYVLIPIVEDFLHDLPLHAAYIELSPAASIFIFFHSEYLISDLCLLRLKNIQKRHMLYIAHGYDFLFLQEE